MVMLVVMLAAIFIGLPISFTLLFLALIFGYIGLGASVFNLAYLQTFGLMKQDEFVAGAHVHPDGLRLRPGRA